MVEYNVERKHLSEAMKITPGKVQELLSYDTVESHGYPPGTIYCERPFGVGGGGVYKGVRRIYGGGRGELYTVVKTSSEQAAVSQQSWLGKLVQNIRNIQFKDIMANLKVLNYKSRSQLKLWNKQNCCR